MERILERLKRLEQRLEFYIRAYHDLRIQVRSLEQRLKEYSSR